MVMERMIKITLVLSLLAFSVYGHVCLLQERSDPTEGGRLRWSVPFNERCLCIRVMAASKIPITVDDPEQYCTTNRTRVAESMWWFTDDPTPLTLPSNSIQAELDKLLNRTDYCYRNECDSNPCLNGGICDDAIGTFICRCSAGYHGEMCQHNINECESNPCQNNGTCTDGIASFSCTCQFGYTGGMCQYINECEPNPCQNGGSCQGGIGSFSCTCTIGFDGILCGNDINECDTNPCENVGTCQNTMGAFTCTCLAGYEGDICQNDINECIPNPCLNAGICDDGIATYVCTCTARYFGDTCQDTIRLVGGQNNNQGRVEVFHNGVWGTVCDDNWAAAQALVVCRQLGLGSGNAVPLGSAAFGQGTGTIWLDNVVCAGSESHLGQCTHIGWENHNCGHHEDAGVTCG